LGEYVKESLNEDSHDDEDVVVIEQRDKKSYLYIGIAAVLGLAIGGLVGGATASNHWESSYSQLEQNLDRVDKHNSKIIAQAHSQQQKDIEQIRKEYDDRIDALKKDQSSRLSQLNEKIRTLTKSKKNLEKQLSTKNTTLKSVESKNTRLNQKADMQASVFERSRELFQKELKIKQEVEKLKKEKVELNIRLKAFKSECNAYLNGTSWDAHSDACDQQDATNSRLSQINQLINVHNMDLKEIKALTQNLGLN